jgi:HSP20 family protein
MTTETQVRRQSEARPERARDRCVYTPPVDIVEQKNGLTLLADMPGVDPGDIDIQYENGVLTLHGRVEPREPQNARHLVREYGTGDYCRTFALGEGIDADKIVAEYKDGVLKLHLPKSEALKPRKIEVKA